MIRKILLPYVIPSCDIRFEGNHNHLCHDAHIRRKHGSHSGMGFYIINYTHYANYTNVVAGIIFGRHRRNPRFKLAGKYPIQNQNDQMALKFI